MNTLNEQSAVSPSIKNLSQIPEGECQCGCGERTKVAKQNHAKYGYVKGKPLRYINGHNRRVVGPRLTSRHIEIKGTTYVTLPLTQGMEAIIDPSEFERTKDITWRVHRGYKTWYAVSGGCGKPLVQLHRLIMCAPDDAEIDHKNHNGLDNRRCNLRIAIGSQNQRNRRKYKKGTSRFLGVSLNRKENKWVAQIKYEGRNRTLGRFDSEEEAALSYDNAARKHFGEFANPNFNTHSTEDDIC